MLGRGCARELTLRRPQTHVADEVAEITREADLFVLNLECCISERGRRWPDPRKPFFFRAPPAAVDLLTHLGVDCVTLANNHALDYGPEALLDTFRHLEAAGIEWVGAGEDVARARAPRVIEGDGFRLAVVGASDHPEAYAADEGRPGIAFADLKGGTLPDWLAAPAGGVDGADAVLVTPHWGPNMRQEPVGHARAAATGLTEAGATLVAGHSAHVFQGVEGRVLYDLGDFVDDYAVDKTLRNDLGLLFLVELGDEGPKRLEAVPLKLDYCHTRLADGSDAAWIRDRFETACAAFGTEVAEESGQLVIEWPGSFTG